MAQHGNVMQIGRPASTGPRPATASPDRPAIQQATPGELNVWLFVSVVPATFVAIIIGLVFVVPH